MKRLLGHAACTAATLLVLLGLATVSVETQGPFSAQIVRALRAWGFSTPGNLTGLANGSVSAPSLAFASDPATGFYRGGAGQINATCNGGTCSIVTLTGLTTPGPLYIGNAQDTALGRAAAAELLFPSVAFAGLGTPANGAVTYCTDCTETTPASCPVTQASCVCAGSGSGAFARRINGVWYCTF